MTDLLDVITINSFSSIISASISALILYMLTLVYKHIRMGSISFGGSADDFPNVNNVRLGMLLAFACVTAIFVSQAVDVHNSGRTFTSSLIAALGLSYFIALAITLLGLFFIAKAIQYVAEYFWKDIKRKPD